MLESHEDHLIRPDSPLRMQAVWVYGSALLLCAAASWLTGGASAPAAWPYIWVEALVVQAVCTLPLAIWLSGAVSRDLRGPALAVGLVAVAVGGWLLVMTGDAPSAPLPGGRVTLAIWRLAATLCAETALLLIAVILRRRPAPANGAGASGQWRDADAGGIVPAETGRGRMLPLWSLCLALAAPALFVEARINRDASRLVDLVEQARFAQAAGLARTLAVLDPRRQIDGYSTADIAAELDRRVAEIAARVEAPLSPSADSAAQLARAYDLAMLGRDAEALQIVAPRADAEALNLAGVLHEELQDWSAGVSAYQRAREAAAGESESADRTQWLAEAARGTAYCQRKLGRNRAAEAAYLELLALVPTAQTHFLLAQFYDDTQQTDLAREHAERAAALAPAEFNEPVSRLNNRLATAHFGCWGISLRETAVRPEDAAE